MYIKFSKIKDTVICIPEIFNTNIVHQLFYYKITLKNSQNKSTNSKGDFVFKISFYIQTRLFYPNFMLYIQTLVVGIEGTIWEQEKERFGDGRNGLRVGEGTG